jgi:hypothetical protein
VVVIVVVVVVAVVLAIYLTVNFFVISNIVHTISWVSPVFISSLVYGLGVLSHHTVFIGSYCLHQLCELWSGVIIMYVLFSSQDISL